jgi:hypothetical protein
MIADHGEVLRPVLAATRVHQTNAARPVDMAALEAFVERALGWGGDVAVAVAVGSEGPLGEALLARVHGAVAAVAAKPRWVGRRVSVVPVAPWGRFVNGLNALVQHALEGGFEHVLFSSVETTVGKEGVDALRGHMTAADLVVGAAFSDHAYQPPAAATAGLGAARGAAVALSGTTTPWNTLALWHVPTLALVGFVGVAEGLDVASGRSDGGVEEVTTIALLQHLAPAGRRGAKLVAVPGLAWATAFEGDDERRAWHARKMASKAARPAAQMARLPGLPAGSVTHF